MPLFRSALGWLVSQYVRRTPLHRGKVRATRTLFRLLPTLPVRGRYGNMMLSVPDDTTVRSLVGTYSDVFECVNRLRAGMALVDVGANVGVFSLFASDRVGPEGRVIAFEPAHETFQRLMGNIALNGSSRIVPINAAIGAETRMVRFDPATPEHSGKAHISGTGSVEVLQLGPAELTPMLEAAAENRETIIKIDVEGAELMVIEALAPFLRSAQVTALVIEINAKHLARFGASEAKLFKFLSELGFEPEDRAASGGHYDQVFRRRSGR
jgi:FkbM family methyltransferase